MPVDLSLSVALGSVSEKLDFEEERNLRIILGGGWW